MPAPDGEMCIFGTNYIRDDFSFLRVSIIGWGYGV